MRNIRYVVAEPDHVDFLASRLRKADVDEAWAAAALRPRETLEISLRRSSLAVTGLMDGEPIGMFGVSPGGVVERVGIPWMLGTSQVGALTREWLTDAAHWLTLLGDGYAVLRNRVDARNRHAIRWLRKMGFRIEPPEPFGRMGLAFHLFERSV